MRRLALGLGLLALSACATQAPPDLTYAVFFEDFSAQISPTGAEIVGTAAATANRFPKYGVQVQGYADRIGSTQAEVALSKARADAVAAMLQTDGVAPARISRTAVGTPPNSQPGVERRRVEIDLVGP